MFDLDETAESRNSVSEQRQAQNGSHSNASQSRNHSSESTGPGGSFFAVGKALALSMALGAAPDHKSPSRRSSHTSHGSAQSQNATSAYSPPHPTQLRADGTSPKTVPYAAHHGHNSGGGGGASSMKHQHLSRENRSDFLMWESGFCSKTGIRESQEDRFACTPNINDQIRQAASSSGAVSGPPVQATLVLAGSASNAKGAPTSSLSALQAPDSLGGGVEGAGGYFGVYDGHGGQAAAVYLERYLLDNICLHPEFTENLQKAVVESCIRTDRDFLVSNDIICVCSKHPLPLPRMRLICCSSILFLSYYLQAECDAKRIYCGTTALGAFVIGSSLLVFNIGDCQAVLCSAGRAVS